MQIVTVQFNYPGRSDYGKLLDVFRYSVKKHMPKIEFIEYKIPAPVNHTGRDLNFNYNSKKLRIWVEHLEKANQEIIFADCDMLCLKNASHAFKYNFDVAYTERTIINRIPMNGGIMFARPTEKAKRFFRGMLVVNDMMLGDITFHHKWRVKYAGMNQAAFGCVLETGTHCAKIHKFKTIEWNAVDCDWMHVNNNTVFVHYKSKLRKMVLNEIQRKLVFQKVINLWDQYYKEMKCSK